jgi:hypothetical protein
MILLQSIWAKSNVVDSLCTYSFGFSFGLPATDCAAGGVFGEVALV